MSYGFSNDLPSVDVRQSAAIGLLLGSLLLGLSCSGPSPDGNGPADAEERPARVFHVQLGMEEEKDVATQTVSEAVAWWNEHASSLAARPLDIGEEHDSPVHLVWKAPLYRVRLGPFASREEAEKVLAAAQSSFPEAFVAPERLHTSQ